MGSGAYPGPHPGDVGCFPTIERPSVKLTTHLSIVLNAWNYSSIPTIRFLDLMLNQAHIIFTVLPYLFLILFSSFLSLISMGRSSGTRNNKHTLNIKGGNVVESDSLKL
jgi:hypothetical protein